jgi:hypothetical protein
MNQRESGATQPREGRARRIAKYGVVGLLTRRQGASAARLAAYVGASCAVVGIPVARVVSLPVAVAVAALIAVAITLMARAHDKQAE